MKLSDQQIFFFFDIDFDMQFLQLFVRYDIRRLRHLIDSALRLRECNHVADSAAVKH